MPSSRSLWEWSFRRSAGLGTSLRDAGACSECINVHNVQPQTLGLGLSVPDGADLTLSANPVAAYCALRVGALEVATVFPYNGTTFEMKGGPVSDAQRWYLRRRPSESFIAQMRALDLDPVLAKVLYARKIDTPAKVRAFLDAEGKPGDPFQMAGMDRAVRRLCRALRDQERVVVYGDFDVDGVCATALLVSALESLGAKVSFHIPDRFNEAYGLTKSALEKLRRQGAELVVTVDCGIRSVEEVAYAQSLGLEVIVTDHHSVPAELPPALAIINPKRPDCSYPFKALAGVGVGYRLVEALCKATRPVNDREGHHLDPTRFLDLVALGTVADIVPLRGENRVLVRHGLRMMRESPRPGLRALLERADIQPDKVDSQAISFRLGPRLNAAGRLRSATLAYDLLLSRAEDESRRLAGELDAINRQRQQLLEKQLEKAREIIGQAEGPEGPIRAQVLFVEGPDFHEGIVGLVASRLVEEFYRPSLVMRRGETMTRGSARSIDGFDITRALDHCSELFERYGGHVKAAGFTVPTRNLAAFRQRMETYSRQHLTEDMLRRKHSADALVSLYEISEATPVALSLLEPCGEGNPLPALASQGLRVEAIRAVGNEGKHLRLQVREGTKSLPAIAFRLGHLATRFKVGDIIDLIYRPQLNEWQGQVFLQVVVEAMRASRVPSRASASPRAATMPASG